MTTKEANEMRRFIAANDMGPKEANALRSLLADMVGGIAKLEARVNELEKRQEAETDLAEGKELIVHDLKREVEILKHQLSHGSAFVQLNKEERN